MEAKAIVPERALVAKAQAGSEEAFTELVRRHSGQIYGLSLNMLRNREDAEDNVQNVLVKAFHNINRFEGNSQFSTWLVRIAINEALMKLRKRQSERISDYQDIPAFGEEPKMFPDIEDVRQNPEREYISKELTRKAFRGLNPSLQDTFILQKAEGWTNRELAAALGITVSTVKSRVFRARVRLRNELQMLTGPRSVAALQN
ncbi:MAG TPA: sigma-70 family RNA polymerase sigma factor [Candidatus Acidoferrum sp.]|jgi:RNA polymerase sigma-70 factor (ECF subfamily)